MNSVYTFVVALAFGITSLLLCIYDKLVTRRQERTKNAALRVVSSMFPSTVQDKVLKGHYDGAREDSDKDENVIASFFPETTVMFGTYCCFEPLLPSDVCWIELSNIRRSFCLDA